MQRNLRVRLKLKNMREYLHDRSLQWFGHVEKMEESAWSSKRRIFKINGSFCRGQLRKTWNEVIRSNLKEGKVNRDLARQKCLEVFHKKPFTTYKHGRHVKTKKTIF